MFQENFDKMQNILTDIMIIYQVIYLKSLRKFLTNLFWFNWEFFLLHKISQFKYDNK